METLEKIREEIAPEDKIAEIPPLPEKTQLHVQMKGSKTEILIPTGWDSSMSFLLLYGAGVSMFFSVIMIGVINNTAFSKLSAPIFLQISMIALALAPFLIILFATLKVTNSLDLLEIAPQLFRVTEISPFGKEMEKFSTEKIEKIEIVSLKNSKEKILIGNGEEEISFGGNISKEEREWIYKLIQSP